MIDNLIDEFLIELLVLAVGGPVLMLASFLCRKAGSSLLRTTLWVSQIGLPETARQYLLEWFASWEHEAREDQAHRLREGGLATELYLLARVLTLPLCLFSLRHEAVHRVISVYACGMGTAVMEFGDGTAFHVNYQSLRDPEAPDSMPLPHFPFHLVRQEAPLLVAQEAEERPDSLERTLPGTMVRQLVKTETGAWILPKLA